MGLVLHDSSKSLWGFLSRLRANALAAFTASLQQGSSPSSSSMAGKPPSSLSRKRTLKIALAVAANLVLFASAYYFYSLSLEAKDLDWLHKNAPRLSLYVAYSIVCFTAALQLVLFLVQHTAPVHLLFGVALPEFIVFHRLVSSNVGTTPESHGAFNAIGFCYLATLLNVILCGCSFVKRRTTWPVFLRGLGVFLMLFGGFQRYQLHRYEGKWTEGLSGRKMDVSHPGLCAYPQHLALQDLLPTGAMNFWAEEWWRSCSTGQGSFSAEWAAENGAQQPRIVVRGCSVPPTVVILPNTKLLHYDRENQEMRRVEDQSERVVYEDAWPYMEIPVHVSAVRVECGSAQSKLLIRIPDRTAVASAVLPPPADASTNVNVLIMFLDSVSRRMMHRRLPKTMRALERVESEAADATQVDEFFRYSSVGHSTNPNTCAMYQGNSECRGDLPTIWETFHKRGYVTLRADTACEDWSYITSRTKTSAFVDYEFIAPFCAPEYVDRDAPHGNFKGPYSLRTRCLAGRQVHDHAFEILSAFQAHMARPSAQQQPWFALMSMMEGHEGSTDLLARLDEPLAALLGTLNRTNTAVFLVADHGNHMSLYKTWSLTGQVEFTNPALITLLPKKKQKSAQYLDAVRHNSQVLTTPFNVFHTLHVLAGDEGHLPDSLFAPQSRDATCMSARIPEEFCTCV